MDNTIPQTLSSVVEKHKEKLELIKSELKTISESYSKIDNLIHSFK